MFTDKGSCHQVRVLDVPMSKLKDKGVPIDNISNYDSSEETILMMDSFDNLKEKILIFVTAHGMIKKVNAAEFESVKRTIQATKLAEGDSLVYVSEICGSETVLVTSSGQALRFSNEDISLFKKTSVGVRGMKLDDGDTIAGVYDLDPEVKYIVKIGNKRVNLNDLKLKKRDARPDLIK